MSDRLTTTRVRPWASTAVRLSATPIPMSCERCARPLLVSGKSNAIRAGLSIVKLSGAGAGLLRVRVICALFPGNPATSTDCRVLPELVSAAHTEAVLPIIRQAAANRLRHVLWPLCLIDLIKVASFVCKRSDMVTLITVSSLWDYSLIAIEAWRSIQPPIPSGTISVSSTSYSVIRIIFP